MNSSQIITPVTVVNSIVEDCGPCKTNVVYSNSSTNGIGGFNGTAVCSLAEKCTEWVFELKERETTVVSEVIILSCC